MTRLPAQAQFERWLRDQPGVLTVRMDASRALASGVQAARVPTPTATATMAGPLRATVVGDFMQAFERYAAEPRQGCAPGPSSWSTTQMW